MRLLTTAAAAVCLALPVGVASAGRISSERVPSGSNFVVHVDIEALHDSKVGQALLEILMEQGLDAIDDVEEELGFNPLDVLHDVTVSGNDQDGEDVVIVATGHRDLLDALDRLREEAENVDEREEDGVEFTRYAGDGDGDEAINIWTSESRDVVTIVASPDVDALVRGVRTFRGRDDGADIDAPRNSFVLIMAHSLEGVDAGPAAAVLQLSKGVMINIGEDDDELSIDLQMHAESEDAAKALAQMVQGLAAFAKVAMAEEMEDDRALDLLDGLTFDTDGSLVSIRLHVDPDDLGEFMHD